MTSQKSVQSFGSAMDVLRAVVPTPPCEQRDLKSASPCKEEVINLSPTSASPNSACLADVEARLKYLTAELAVLHSTVDTEALRFGVPLEKMYDGINLRSTVDLEALQWEVPLEAMYDALNGAGLSLSRTPAVDSVGKGSRRETMSPTSSQRALSLDSVFDITPTDKLTPVSVFAKESPERLFQLHQEFPEQTPLSPPSLKLQTARTGSSKVDQTGEFPQAVEAEIMRKPGSVDLPMPKWLAKAMSGKQVEQAPIVNSDEHGENTREQAPSAIKCEPTVDSICIQAAGATIEALNVKIDALHAMLSKSGSETGATSDVQKNVQKMWHHLSDLMRSAEKMAEQARKVQSEVEEEVLDSSTLVSKQVGSMPCNLPLERMFTAEEDDNHGLHIQSARQLARSTEADAPQTDTELRQREGSSMVQLPAATSVSRSSLHLPLPPREGPPRSHRASLGASSAVATPRLQTVGFVAPTACGHHGSQPVARRASLALPPQGRTQTPMRKATGVLPPFASAGTMTPTPPTVAPVWNRRHTLGHARPAQYGLAPQSSHSNVSTGLASSRTTSQSNVFAYTNPSVATRPVSAIRASTPRALTPCALRPSSSVASFQFGQ